ncbi:hypothetical protein W59_23575 [Rhodococcus opacus RKJ300 = JCM 13270]|uniref:Uncharacterized protein n=1 Tax=Rhodococcus opacus RKJ300 = JCM 13270 TaxID=1165867 RepID=I0WM44_RHOOP|nr:hypothetical protein W59_23575 [Rhodococcus opacus RKJ300 = JCM 13270]
MDTDSTPESENEPDARPAAAPVPTPGTSGSAPASTASLEHDVRVATRTGRYALATALCAAIVSSVVSAGSAVYVSRNELARKESAAAAAEVRENRQRVYADLMTGVAEYVEGLGFLEGTLTRNLPDRETVRAATDDLTGRGGAAIKTVNMVFLVGSMQLVPTLDEFMHPYDSFVRVHLNPFILHKFGGSGDVTDPDGLLRDGPGLVDEIDRMMAESGEFVGDFLVRAREDLGTG